MTRTTKIIIIFSVVAALALSTILYFAYQARIGSGFEIELKMPDQVFVGVPFDLDVNLINNSGNPLQNVQLFVQLPEGVAFVGSPATKSVDVRDMKNIGDGGLQQQVYKLIVSSGENSIKQIFARAIYSSGSLKSRFERRQEQELAVGGYGLQLDISTPQKTFSGEDFDIEVFYKNVSDQDFSDLKLKLDYPPTFNFKKSTLKPDTGNNIWVLGGLRKGSEMKFKVTGNLVGPDGSFFDLKAAVEANLSGHNYPVNVKTATLSIAPSPLSIRIELNDNPDYVAKAGDSLNYTLTYVNNTDTGLRDVVIRAQLVGAMFDVGTLSTNGSLRSSDNTIIWNASNVPQLASLPPGANGNVDFTLRAKNDFPIKRLSDKNFTLKVASVIESPTVPQFVEATKTMGASTLETKVGGQIKLEAKVFFRDAESGIINKGPLPLKVGKPTQFTVHWILTNYGTDVKTIQVRAFLGGNVKYAGVSKSTTGQSPVYNDNAQEMYWDVNRIAAGTGVVNKPAEAIFQIEATPSVTNLNQFMDLIQKSTLTGIDEFTNLEIKADDQSVSSSLPDDPTASGQGIVVQ
ncbi:MAG: Uncharacterized protein G01um10143_347 [Parcubacteria group bacterium Gr01-1014_3]|nr:MAG: Uncharacterized protein G01um10143_347 [Parcubacteria group bacterium Gr01-1014_3]